MALVDCGWDWLKASESSALREGSGSNLTVLENTDPELLEDDLGGDDVGGLNVDDDVTLVNVDHQGALVVFSNSSFLGSSFSFVNVRLQMLDSIGQIQHLSENKVNQLWLVTRMKFKLILTEICPVKMTKVLVVIVAKKSLNICLQ